MRNLMLLALLAAAASTGLATPWWLLLIPVWLGVRWVLQSPAASQPGEVVVATIYERQGKLVMRRTSTKENT